MNTNTLPSDFDRNHAEEVLSKLMINFAHRPKKFHVLVIHQDEQFLEFSRNIFGRAGISCSLAGSSAEAFIMVNKNTHYDVVFVEERMMNMDGIDLEKRMKDCGINMESVVLMDSLGFTTRWSDKIKPLVSMLTMKMSLSA